MRRLEPFEDVGEEIGADREHGGDLDRAPARRAQVVDRLAGQRHRVEDLLGVRPERAPGRREGEAGLATLEEAHAEGVFEGANARAHGRLGQPQRRRGPPKAAEGADRQKRFDLRDLHDAKFRILPRAPL